MKTKTLLLLAALAAVAFVLWRRRSDVARIVPAGVLTTPDSTGRTAGNGGPGSFIFGL